MRKAPEWVIEAERMEWPLTRPKAERVAAVFDLTQNPFHLLDASVRARREEVVEAHEEALANGRADEAALIRAQQAVLTPRSRIEAEVSWLPGVAPSQAKDLLFRLQQGTFDEAYGALGNLQGLDKANLAADLCIRSGGDTGYARELLEAYGEFTTGDVLDTLAGSRSVSGFPTPDEQQVEKALATLKVSHAKAAVACITAADSPSKEMTEIVEVFLGSGEHAVEHLLDLIVREYDAWSEPHLAMIKEKIEAATSAYRQGDGPLAVNQIVEQLSEWDHISQPVQLLEESKGHEEPRSKEIYRIVRDFCLWLANENDHYEEALMISRALLETFPELPALAAQLAQDVDALESLAEEAKSIKLMKPLIEAQEAVQAWISAFDGDLAVSGFGPKSRGLAKWLYDAFADVAARTVATELADMPWMVVRGLAIDLNNEHDSPEGACAILEGLLAHKGTAPSQAVVDKLKVDQRTLLRNLKWEELKRISGDVPKGISLVSELLDGADADERATLLQLKTALERKRVATVRKWVFWGLAATAFVGFLIYDANKKTSYSPRLPPTATLTPSTPQPSSPPSSSTSPQLESQFDEQMPPPGINNTLNRSEVRYCVFQDERLNILRELTTNNQEIGRFNGLVADYNSRCSSFRYRQGVLQTVEAEVPGKQHDLRMDVQRLLTSWRRSPTSPSVDASIINTTTASGAALVQSRLKELGYYAGAVDGIWGPASRTALRNFKLAHSGLGYDDRWDLATQKALMGR